MFKYQLLFGPECIGNYFKEKDFSVAVAYGFKGNIITVEVFDKDGMVMQSKKRAE